MNNPTVISLFAGCGGSSLGYKLAGFRELLAVEWDNNAVDTFRRNFPEVPVFHGDIAKLTGEECCRLAGGIQPGMLDVLDGSPPCQGFSTAGKRKFDDPRNSLFKEFARLLDYLKPKVFVMENVTGLVKGVMKQAYVVIVKTLKACGYRVKGVVMNAMYFNVPQSRQRVIIIGVREDMDVEPSHPKPQTTPMPAKDAFGGVENKTFGRPFTTLARNIWDAILPGQKGCCFRQGYYRDAIKVHPSKPVPTIKKVLSGIGGHTHWSEPRSLSIEELKRAASFPDRFCFHGSYSQQWARIGNSVPPNLMKAIAEHVKDNIIRADNATA